MPSDPCRIGNYPKDHTQLVGEIPGEVVKILSTVPGPKRPVVQVNLEPFTHHMILPLAR